MGWSRVHMCSHCMFSPLVAVEITCAPSRKSDIVVTWSSAVRTFNEEHPRLHLRKCCLKLRRRSQSYLFATCLVASFLSSGLFQVMVSLRPGECGYQVWLQNRFLTSNPINIYQVLCLSLPLSASLSLSLSFSLSLSVSLSLTLSLCIYRYMYTNIYSYISKTWQH